MKYLIEITKESGEVILTESFATELAAHDKFEELEAIRYPLTYKGLTMNLFEYPDGRVCSVRVVVKNEKTGVRYVRRELWRKE